MSHEADARRHRRAADQRRAAVAARGVRRLRRAARRRPADRRPRPARSSSRCAATGRRTHLPGPGRVRPDRDATSGRRTRAPGWPAWCWPTLGGQDALVRLYERVSGGAELAAAAAVDVRARPRRELTRRWRERLQDLAGVTATDGRVTAGCHTGRAAVARRGGGRSRCLRRPGRAAGALGPGARAGRCTRRRRRASSPPRRSRAPRTSAAGPGLELVLAGGLAAAWRACSASPSSAPGWWTGCAGRGGGGSSGGRGLAVVGRLVTLPFAVLLRRRRARLRAVRPGVGGLRRRPAQGLGVDVVATSLVAARAGRLRPALAARLARRGRRCCSPALVLLGSFVYPLLVEPLFNYFTPLPDGPLRTQILALADEEGVHGRRRAGGRRVPAYDDAQRLRLRLRQHPPGRGLRQPRRRLPRTRGALGGRPRARARPARRRARPARCSAPPARCSASACSGLLVGRRGSGGRRRAGVPLVLALVARGRRCWPARCRTASAGGSRPAPTWTRCAATGDPAAFVEMQTAAGAAVAGRPDAAGLVAVLVRQPPDRAAADRARRAVRPRPTAADEMHDRRPVATGSEGRSRGQWISCRIRAERVREDRLAAVLEHAVDATTEGEDDDGDQGGDARDEEAVLDGGGAALACAADASRERLELWLRAECPQPELGGLIMAAVRRSGSDVSCCSRSQRSRRRWRSPSSRCR